MCIRTNRDKCKKNILSPLLGYIVVRGVGQGVGGTSRGGSCWHGWIVFMLVLVGKLAMIVETGPKCVVVGICQCCD